MSLREGFTVYLSRVIWRNKCVRGVITQKLAGKVGGESPLAGLLSEVISLCPVLLTPVHLFV